MRFAPQRPRWTDRFRQPPFLSGDRLSTASGPDGRPALLTVLAARHQWGQVTRGLAGRDAAAWTAEGSAASPTPALLPATAPRPASGDADQTPLGHEGGM